MDNKEYIYVLDYSDCAIYEIIRDIDDKRKIEDIFKDYGCDINTCSWMITSDKINKITNLNID